MKGAVLRGGTMVIESGMPEPEPGAGQVLVQVRACGICGSDLHFVKHGHRMVELAAESDLAGELDLGRDVFMGHEFAAEVLDAGPDTVGAPAPGTLVVSIPAL